MFFGLSSGMRVRAVRAARVNRRARRYESRVNEGNSRKHENRVTKYEVRALMVMMMENRHMTEFPTRVIIPFGLLL